MTSPTSPSAAEAPVPAVTWYLHTVLAGAERLFPLHGRRVLVGSSESCDIILPVAGVSRRHARLEVASEGLRVRDLGSLNGTWVDERPVSGGSVGLLAPGGCLRLGPVELVVETGSAADLISLRSPPRRRDS